jgi:hypothetical protein
MKTITEYQCEICYSKYTSKEAAIRCEEKGVPDLSKLPIGLMFEYHHNGLVGIFCIARVNSGAHGHYVSLSYWCFRVPGYPPHSIDEQMTSGDIVSTEVESMNHFIKCHCITKEGEKMVEFAKMITYLKGRDIQPIYYTPEGEKVIVP